MPELKECASLLEENMQEKEKDEEERITVENFVSMINFGHANEVKALRSRSNDLHRKLSSANKKNQHLEEKNEMLEKKQKELLQQCDCAVNLDVTNFAKTGSMRMHRTKKE